MPNRILTARLRSLIDSCLWETGCEAIIRYDEPMAAHTTFKVGGPADCWVQPSGAAFPAFAVALFSGIRAETENVPVFILGGGANIVVADRGIRGIVLDTTAWTGLAEPATICGFGVRMSFRSGTAMDTAAELAAEAGLSGLEFLAGMPGSIGGGVWMNARCYEREIADVLIETETLEFVGESGSLAHKDSPRFLRIPVDPAVFGYKRSPFQKKSSLILRADFMLQPADEAAIRGKMETCRRDREAKGHYRYPSAGSAFKNNRDFGEPVGRIIDKLGLRGLRSGGAQVAPFHGNIIINTGGAGAADIRALVNEAATKVRSATGLILESEILFVGDW